MNDDRYCLLQCKMGGNDEGLTSFTRSCLAIGGENAILWFQHRGRHTNTIFGFVSSRHAGYG